MGKVIMSGIVPQLKVPVNLPPIGKSLNDYTWKEISSLGIAPIFRV